MGIWILDTWAIEKHPKPALSVSSFLMLIFQSIVWLTIQKDQLKMCLPIKVIFAQRERVKLLSSPKKCYFHSPLYVFWLTMTSKIESSRWSLNTLLYEKWKFERKSSQWRILYGLKNCTIRSSNSIVPFENPDRQVFRSPIHSIFPTQNYEKCSQKY